jgi:dethiobiotin synthetase
LTAQSVAASGLELAAWIGSHIDPSFARIDENLATLAQRLRRPPAAIVPHGAANFAVSF